MCIIVNEWVDGFFGIGGDDFLKMIIVDNIIEC